MFVVSYNITIGSASFKTKDSALVAGVTVQNSLDTPASSAVIMLATDADISAKAGDAVTVELGTKKATETVFTGMVESIEYSISTIRVQAISAVEALARLRVNAVFENMSCGAICKDLASLAEVSVGKADDGVTFPRYVISDSKNVWQHIKQLSMYSGTDIYTDPDDTFNFVTYAKAMEIKFTYGENILEAEKSEITPSIDGVEVYGESPAGQGQSDEANFWMKKEEVFGSAGNTSGTIVKQAVYAAKNKDLCGQIATNLFEPSKIKARGRVVVLGGEKVSLGKTISLAKMPATSMNGKYKVTAITHQLNKESGFTTEIEWEEF